MDNIDWRKLQDHLAEEIAADAYRRAHGTDPVVIPNIVVAHNHFPMAVDPLAALDYWGRELDKISALYAGEARMVTWSHVYPVIDRSGDSDAELSWHRARIGLRYRIARATAGDTRPPDRREMADYYLALTVPVQPDLPKRVRPDYYIWASPQVDSMARLAQARPRTPLTPGEVARVQATRRRQPSALMPATLSRIHRGLRRYGGMTYADFD